MNTKEQALSEADGVREHLIAAFNNYKSEGFFVVDLKSRYDKPQFALVHPDGRIWIVTAQAGKAVLVS